MKTNHTDLTVVLDRSGSMHSVASDTIGGFNQFLRDQKKASGTATLTLNQFDDVFERVVDAKDIQLVPALTRDTYIPRGSTALLDAIGRSIHDTGKRLNDTPKADRPGKVVVVIMTDGYENASREFTRAQVNDMIAHQRDTYNWEFVFLGADQDAIAEATSLGISGHNAMSYMKNSAGTTSAFLSVSKNLTAFRCSASDTMAYTDLDRKNQEDAGLTS